MNIADDFMRKNGSIRNRELREAANIDYDQAILFFNRAIVAKRLFRQGSSSATHYVPKLPAPTSVSAPKTNYR